LKQNYLLSVQTPLLIVEIKFGNNQTYLETASYKPTKKSQREHRDFQFQMMARGAIEHPTQGFLTLGSAG
jgi:hypothetical protein